MLVLVGLPVILVSSGCGKVRLGDVVEVVMMLLRGGVNEAKKTETMRQRQFREQLL